MLRSVGTLLRKKYYSAGCGERLGGPRGTPTCQQLPEPRPRGGKGGDNPLPKVIQKEMVYKTRHLHALRSRGPRRIIEDVPGQTHFPSKKAMLYSDERAISKCCLAGQ